MTRILSGIKDILGHYDLAIIDQWGVLHNGVVPFRGAVDAVAALHEAGTKIIVLSNSGKLASHSHRLIGRMGFNMDAIHKVISSGQAAREWLIDKKDPLAKNIATGDKKKLLFWGFDDDHRAIDDLGFIMTDAVEEADIILAAGAGRGALEAYQDEMDIGIKKNITMLCTNPDMVANMPDGSLKICPGSLAKYYEEQGGHVVRFGKPAKEVYDMCKQEFPAARKIIGIGDSLEHDIAGARVAEIDSLFILGGIHAADFYHGIDKQRMENLFKTYDATPHFVLDSFHL